MPPLPIVLLPGLHGTSELFDSFVAAAPSHLRPLVLTLPESGSYAELAQQLSARLPAGKFAILAESFSGPLAIALAREMPERIVAVILSNTFVSAPRNRLFRFLPWSLLLRIPAPGWAIRYLVAGWQASPALVSAVRAAIRRQPPSILAARMQAIFALSRSGTEAAINVPLLLFTGSEDHLVPPDSAAPPLEKIARTSRRVVLRAPHLLLQTASAEAWNAITEFLESNVRT
jgi:pimeloyl-[acyl-carrier protein] methyl ester esterase